MKTPLKWQGRQWYRTGNSWRHDSNKICKFPNGVNYTFAETLGDIQGQKLPDMHQKPLGQNFFGIMKAKLRKVQIEHVQNFCDTKGGLPLSQRKPMEMFYGNYFVKPNEILV